MGTISEPTNAEWIIEVGSLWERLKERVLQVHGVQWSWIGGSDIEPLPDPKKPMTARTLQTLVAVIAPMRWRLDNFGQWRLRNVATGEIITPAELDALTWADMLKSEEIRRLLKDMWSSGTDRGECSE